MHRGSGDVYPEHSMSGYRAAFDSGALCMEVSVDITSDGVLVCMHDLTLDRTTTGHGRVRDVTSEQLRAFGIRQPQLGPFWSRTPLPAIPLLRDVLEAFGGRMVLCLEAKADAAYEPMMRMVEEMRLTDSVVVKAYWRSTRIAAARVAGYPLFVYLGPQDMRPGTIMSVARTLNPARDYLVVPTTSGGSMLYYPDDLIDVAVRTGVPTWVYPVHRRTDAAHFFDLGVAGVVSSSHAYTTDDRPTATRDAWASKRVMPGEMSRYPEDSRVAPRWTGTADLTMDVPGTQQFLTLGQLAPLAAAAADYRINFAAQWAALPTDTTTNLTLAFGHEDDAYYEHRLGRSNGYHALIRPDGRLQLYRHDAGEPDGVLLNETATTAPATGQWMSFQLDVTPTTIMWSRTDEAVRAIVPSTDSRYRGGYVHLGRSAYNHGVSAVFRDFVVS